MTNKGEIKTGHFGLSHFADNNEMILEIDKNESSTR